MDREALEAAAPVDSSLEFDRIIMLINPNSTRSQIIKNHVKELEASHYGDRITKLYSFKEHLVNQELLLNNLKANDLLVVAGGDGTVHEAATIVTKDLTGLGVKLLLLPGGNAGDLSYSVHGPGQLPTLSQILDNGRSLRVHPIDINTASETKQSDGIAVGYAGFGFTALAARVLNSPLYRKLPFYANPLARAAYESTVAVTSVLRSPPFKIERDGEVEELSELLAANGRRVAKRLSLPVGLEEDRIFVSRLETRRHRRLLMQWAGEVALHRQPSIKGLFLSKANEEVFSFITRSPVTMQLDGEPRELGADTEVVIKQSEAYLDIVKYRAVSAYS